MQPIRCLALLLSGSFVCAQAATDVAQPSTAAVAAPSPPYTAVVLTGQNNHDWRFTSGELAAALRDSGCFTVTVVDRPATYLAALNATERPQLFVLDYNGDRWGEAAEQAFTAAVEAGTGVTVVHAANNAFAGWRDYERLVGLLWRDGAGHGRYHPFDVHVVDPHHAITRGMQDLRRHPDELYHGLTHADGSEHRVLLSAFSDPQHGGTGRFEPMALVGRFGEGRVFHTTLGHTWQGVPQSRATWADPQLRWLVARGSEWAASGAVTLSPVPPNVLADAERQQGFVALFDGRSLAGWRAYRGDGPPGRGWVVRELALVHEAGGGGGDLVSEREYAEFEFRFRFRLGRGANSGVMWHVQEDAEASYMSGPEYQLLDDLTARPEPRHGTGALYDLVAPREPVLRPAGEWNDGRILVQAGRVQHWLNGELVVDAPCRGPEWEAMVAGSKFRTWPFGKAGAGRLALQDHGDEVAFRDLRIRTW